MEKLISLINEVKELVDKLGVIDVTIHSEVFEKKPEIFLPEYEFFKCKHKYDWQTKTESYTDDTDIEHVVIDGVKIFALHSTYQQ